MCGIESLARLCTILKIHEEGVAFLEGPSQAHSQQFMALGDVSEREFSNIRLEQEFMRDGEKPQVPVVLALALCFSSHEKGGETLNVSIFLLQKCTKKRGYRIERRRGVFARRSVRDGSVRTQKRAWQGDRW